MESLNIEEGYKMFTSQNTFTLLALISGLGGAWLSFKRSFFKDLQAQMIDLRNTSGIGNASVSFLYRFVARVFIGKECKWIDLFDSNSETNKKMSDKTISLRILFWFFLTFLFSFLTWFSSLKMLP